MVVNKSDDFSIVCLSTGVPIPSFSWLHIFNDSYITNVNGSDVGFVIDEEHGKSVLTVSGVTSAHGGVYRCRGYNGVDNYVGTPEIGDTAVTVQSKRHNIYLK